ncbi:MAG: Asp-tRNA(Asn)/Glu-tRNA(Gln) amidotransferase subunit GatA [Bacteroidia bacterium]|nr:Asp-tRNA(Asn)/Glu-tRNA(Gln) amidotransferase subunit GatA [Bacteroidia bacterium]
MNVIQDNITLSAYYQLRQLIASGEATCVGAVQTCLDSAAKYANLNAFIELFTEEALLAAHESDKRFQNNTARPLEGLVLSIKDNICLKGHTLTASSNILGEFKSLITSSALQQLIDAGAIVLGRTNCDEFAMGSANEYSRYGAVRNGLDTDRVPGGSSGGAAVSVQIGACHVALGSDTGGSVRQPASFCGLFGLKPTYGRISRYGVIAYGSSFDQIGILAHSALDIAIVLEYLAGQDPKDNTSSTQPVSNYFSQSQETINPKRFAILRQTVESEGLQPEIKDIFLQKVEQLSAAGHHIEYVDFPYLDYLVPAYYVLTTAEASSNLARFDGIRYGYRSQTAKTLDELYCMSRSEGFGQEVQRRILLGTFVLSAGYYDAYYTKAQKVRRILFDYTQNLLTNFDFLISPTTPTTAFCIGEKLKDSISMYLSDIYTVQANLAGNPAISIPIGVDNRNLPIGLHLLGKQFHESELLQFAQFISKTS